MKKLRLGKYVFVLLLSVLMMINMMSIAIYAYESSNSEDPQSAFSTTNSSEVLELREENVKHFNMGDGTFQAVAYSHPVHQLDINGDWQDIDFGLKLTSARSNRVYTSEVSGAAFAQNYVVNQPIMTLSEEENSISMSLITTNADNSTRLSTNTAVAAEVTNPQNCFQTIEDAKSAIFSSKVLYEEVLPGVDLEYIVDPGTVKENIIVKAKSDSYQFAFSLDLDGLYPVMRENGAIIWYDTETDEQKYKIPAPYMFDALGNVSEDVSYALNGSGNTYTLIVTASADWINAEERQFPVTIDPSYVVSSGSAYDTYIDSDNPSTPQGDKTALWVRSNRISYIRVPTPSLPYYASVDWATLTAYYFYFGYVSSGAVNVSAHRVTEAWGEDTLTWNSATNWENYGLSTTVLDTVTTVAGNATSSKPTRADFFITNTFKSWVNGTSSNYGIGLQYATGSTNLSVVFKSIETGYDYRPRVTCSYSVNDGAFFSALQEIYGFTTGEATLIMKLYSQVDEKFSNKSIYRRAWMSARLLGGLVYGNDTSLSGSLSEFKWNNVAGEVFTGTEKDYYINTLGFTSAEYTQLRNLVQTQHSGAYSANEGDFAHMQISLAARLAFYLDLDGLASNIAGDDETVAYLAGWLGDATLITNGTTSFGNDDYIADLDAENIYRQILQGKSITSASDRYYSNLSSSTRAQIFTSYIPYPTVKDKVYYELIDKDLYTQIALLQEQGDFITVQSLLALIEDEEYHEDLIKSNYPDTYDFLQSIYNMRNTIGNY